MKLFILTFFVLCLSISNGSATQDHVVFVYIPIIYTSESQPELFKIGYGTYSSSPETEISALFRPFHFQLIGYKVDAKFEDENLITRSKIKLVSFDLIGENSSGRYITLDVSNVEIPEGMEYSKSILLEATQEAIKKTLLELNIDNYELNILGLEKHPELKMLKAQ